MFTKLAPALVVVLALVGGCKDKGPCKPVPTPAAAKPFVLDGGHTCLISDKAAVAEYPKLKDRAALGKLYRSHAEKEGWEVSEDKGKSFRLTGSGHTAYVLLSEPSKNVPFPTASIVAKAVQ